MRCTGYSRSTRYSDQKFFSEVKKVYPSFVVNMYPVHKLNADIKSIVSH